MGDKEYVLPKVEDYVKNAKIAKVISKSKDSFITLTREDEINSIGFRDYPNFIINGIHGSGKSNFVENIIINILLNGNPKDDKLFIIDTIILEYSLFKEIPNLLCPITDDLKKALTGLQKIVSEVYRRYDVFAEKGVKDIDGYNKLNNCHMSSIYVIIDDLVEILGYSKKEYIDAITQLIQRGRQVGVYPIVVTTNIDMVDSSFINMFSNRVTFRAYSESESKLLLNEAGAEKLGEYEYYINTAMNKYDGKYKSYKIDDSYVEKLVKYVKDNYTLKEDDFFKEEVKVEESIEEEDPISDEILEFVKSNDRISTSVLQRRFRLGYNKAARIIDLLEERGIIGEQEGSLQRKVLVHNEDNNVDIEPSEEIEDKNVLYSKIFVWVLIIIFIICFIKAIVS